MRFAASGAKAPLAPVDRPFSSASGGKNWGRRHRLEGNVQQPARIWQRKERRETELNQPHSGGMN